MKKLLHEQLEGGIGKPVKVHANGRVVWLDREDAKVLAAEIKRQYFPRLRYKDGESVQLGGTASFDGNDFEIEKTIYYKSGLVTICEMSGNGHSYMPGDFVERPKPKVFDADGAEIKVGDVVWPITSPDMKMKVDNFQCIYGQAVTVNCEFEGEFYNFNPEKLTNREPDSLEKLRDDIANHWSERISVADSMAFHGWADRLTAIIERGA